MHDSIDTQRKQELLQTVANMKGVRMELEKRLYGVKEEKIKQKLMEKFTPRH